MPIFELAENELRKIEETSFSAAGARERSDLQRLLQKQIEIIAPDTIIIAEEFGDWDDSRRRIDLLGVDKNANLVVFELKRTDDGGHMELQALRYAAMVSTMTFDKAVEVYSEYLGKKVTMLMRSRLCCNFLNGMKTMMKNLHKTFASYLFLPSFPRK
jgi:RecB family endonuclease NucS